MNLDALFPEKRRVDTSLGPLFVRHLTTSDVAAFNGASQSELGTLALRRLMSRVEDKRNHEPIEESDLASLDASDIERLSDAIGQTNTWDMGNDANPYVRSAHGAVAELARLAKEEADFREKLRSDYAFLNSSQFGRLKKHLATSSTIQATLRSEPTTLPRFEDSPVGKATLQSARRAIESAAIAKQTADSISELVGSFGDLQRLFLTDIFPAWRQELKRQQNEALAKAKVDQESSAANFKQARTSLRWTIAGVWLGILATLGTAWWQVGLAKRLDAGNGEQQARSMELLERQLKALEQLNAGQAADGVALRELANRQLAKPATGR